MEASITKPLCVFRGAESPGCNHLAASWCQLLTKSKDQEVDVHLDLQGINSLESSANLRWTFVHGGKKIAPRMRKDRVSAILTCVVYRAECVGDCFDHHGCEPECNVGISARV